MKPALFLLFLFGCTFVQGQTNTAMAGKRTDTLRSAILSEDRYVWVHVPEKATAGSRYPVIYVLDGQVLFGDVNRILNRLPNETGNRAAGEMIVVGIGNLGERYRDYSPTHIAPSAFVDAYSASISGGGEKFAAFLQSELFPYVQSKYPASSTRLLIGHSMGGLEAVYLFLRHPDMFDCYAAIDPSLWWDDQKLLGESKTILAVKKFEKKTLFPAVANTKELDMDVAQLKEDTSAKTVLIRPSLTLVEQINRNRQNGLRFDWKYYKEYHHLSVSAPAIDDALRFFLESL